MQAAWLVLTQLYHSNTGPHCTKQRAKSLMPNQRLGLVTEHLNIQADSVAILL